jgi:hypothetical protein
MHAILPVFIKYRLQQAARQIIDMKWRAPTLPAEISPFCELPQRKLCAMGTISRSAYFSMEKLGLETVPPTRKGNDNRPSFTVAPDRRATILVKKPCLATIIATP